MKKKVSANERLNAFAGFFLAFISLAGAMEIATLISKSLYINIPLTALLWIASLLSVWKLTKTLDIHSARDEEKTVNKK